MYVCLENTVISGDLKITAVFNSLFDFEWKSILRSNAHFCHYLILSIKSLSALIVLHSVQPLVDALPILSSKAQDNHNLAGSTLALSKTINYMPITCLLA